MDRMGEIWKSDVFRNVVACVIATALSVICIVMFMQIDDRVVLHVDNFEITSNTHAFTVGDESDVCFDKVPHDFMEVFVDKDSIRWRVNERYRNTDSLLYYQINGNNPNRHSLSDSNRIFVELDDGVAEISVEEVSSMLEGVENEYVMLRNLLGKKQAELDTTFCQRYDFLKDRGIKSFIYRKKEGLLGNRQGKCQLVILDNRTTLHQDNKEIGYAMAGSNSHYGGRAKVQFFRMTSNAYMEKKVNKKHFAIGDVNYIAKPVVVSTEWGAGHVLVERNEEGVLKCYFPKPITYVERVEELKRASENSSGLLTYRQDEGGFPMSNMLSIPAFSSQVSADICNLSFSGDTILCDNKPLRSSPWLPTFEKTTAGVNGDVGVRVGLLDRTFLWSCVTVPLIFLFLCAVLMWLMLWKIYFDDTDRQRLAGRLMDKLPTYMPAVFLIFFAYIICKAMIAMKLGFTYPFFENVFGVNMVSACLMLLLIFGLSCIINWKYVVADREFGKKIWNRIWPWLFPFFHLVGLVGICVVFNKMIDGHFYSVLRSYLPGDANVELCSLSSWHFWKWRNMNGMTDTFFNVPYTLLLVNFWVILLTVFMVLLYKIKKVREWCESIHERFRNKEKELKNEKDGQLDSSPKTSQRSWRGVIRSIINWIKDVIIALIPALKYIICGVIAILLLCFFPGNFATAPITLLVIVFMGGAFRKVSLGKGMTFGKAMACYLAISLIFIVAAMVGGNDMGYFTNFVGFIFFSLFVYIITEKLFGPDQKREIKYLVGAAVVFFGLLVGGSWLYVSCSDHNTDRTHRRVNMLVNWEEYSNSGKRYAESDAEFVRVMQHYMFNGEEFVASDPLSNDEHILHPSISTGQASVIQNDVSIQGCFFGAYGWITYAVYFGLLVILCWVVIKNALWEKGEIGKWVYWRVLAMFMWVGTSLYLFLSYSGVLPFTGRLNPGFGVDSVGEALETSILIAFMLASSPYAEKEES